MAQNAIERLIAQFGDAVGGDLPEMGIEHLE
jgi:hypothetical protein